MDRKSTMRGPDRISSSTSNRRASSGTANARSISSCHVGTSIRDGVRWVLTLTFVVRFEPLAFAGFAAGRSLRIADTMITNGASYDDPGAGYYARRKPERTKNRAISQLCAVGYDVS
jgi:hypothetical protein